MKLITILLAISYTAFAADVLHVGEVIPSIAVTRSISEVVYTNAKITKIDADGIRVVHDAGPSFIPYEALPDAVKKLFPIDQVAFEERRKTRTQEEMAGREFLRQAEGIKAAQESAAAAKRESEASAPYRIVTITDVKNSWISYLDPKNVPPLNRNAKRMREQYAELQSAVISGQLDSMADQVACQYNIEFYRSIGDAEKVESESQKLIQMRHTDAVRQLSASIRELAYALQNIRITVR